MTNMVSCPPAVEDNDFVVDSFPRPVDKCCSFYLNEYICSALLFNLANTFVHFSSYSEKVNKGIGIENIHYLNDGLWHMKTYKWNNRNCYSKGMHLD